MMPFDSVPSSRARATKLPASGPAVVAARVLLRGALAACAALPAGRAAAHTVVIEATGYKPLALEVKRGDTVVWVNKDPFPHTATATAKGGFDSGSIAAGASWKRVFAKPGDYAYICSFHPNMKATVHVD
jgi:plastocyanin